MIWALGTLAVLAIATELGLYYLFPRVLAWWAIVPLGAPVVIRIDPGALAALGSVVEGEGAYRERREVRVELERVADFEARETGFEAWIRPARREVVIRLRKSSGQQGLGLARSTLEVRGHEIVMRTRQVPMPLSIGIALVLLGVHQYSLFALAIPVLVVAMTTALSRSALHDARRASTRALKDAIESKGAASARR